MRIAVMGAGGIGGYVGARLAEAGRDGRISSPGARIWRPCGETASGWNARSAT